MIGGVVAVVSAVVGVFTVLRGQSFGGHALTDVSTAGGSGALLIGMNPLLGFVGLGVVGAGVMEVIGVRRPRGRDLATGIVLGAAIGLAALFLYLDTDRDRDHRRPQQILFGSIFTVASGTIPAVVVLGASRSAPSRVVYRPLLLSSVSTDIAAARGVPVRLVGLLYMLALAVSVGLSSLAIGAILSTALLIGPAATALRLTTSGELGGRRRVPHRRGGDLARRPARLRQLLLGASHQGLPVSFFIVAVVFVAYLLSGLPAAGTAGRRGSRSPRAPAAAAGDEDRGLSRPAAGKEAACSPGS